MKRWQFNMGGVAWSNIHLDGTESDADCLYTKPTEDFWFEYGLLIAACLFCLSNSMCGIKTSGYYYNIIWNNWLMNIHGLSLQLYLAAFLQLNIWVKYYNPFDWYATTN